MVERWLPVPGYEGAYEVSDRGRMRSLAGGRRSGGILKHRLTRGYHHVGLYKGGKVRTHRVHRLVLTAFVGPPPDGMVALHRDDDQDNNTLANLYWGTLLQNSADLKRNGRNYWANKDRCKQGHEFTERNTYIRLDTGTRQCRQCTLNNNRKRRGVKTIRGLYGGKGGDNYVD